MDTFSINSGSNEVKLRIIISVGIVTRDISPNQRLFREFLSTLSGFNFSWLSCSFTSENVSDILLRSFTTSTCDSSVITLNFIVSIETVVFKTCNFIIDQSTFRTLRRTFNTFTFFVYSSSIIFSSVLFITFQTSSTCTFIILDTFFTFIITLFDTVDDSFTVISKSREISIRYTGSTESRDI